MKSILYIFLFTPFLLEAQNWQWGRKLLTTTGSNYYFCNISNVTAGNIYLLCHLNYSGLCEIKHFKENGTHDWDLPLPSNLTVTGMVTDSSGNLVVCGSYSDTVTLGSFTLNSAGLHDAFFMKVDSTAQVLFAQSLGGAKDETSYAVAVNSSDEIYLATLLHDSLYTGFNKILADTSATEVVIARYDPVGNLLSAFKESEGQYHYLVEFIKMMVGPSGNIYGLFYISYYAPDSYAKIISPAGNVTANKYFLYATDLAIDSEEHPYVLFNPATHYEFESTIRKCDQQLNTIWTRSFGGTYDTYELAAIRIDSHDRLFLAGRNGNSYFGGSDSSYHGNNTFGSQVLSYGGRNTALLAELDTAGNYVHVTEHPIKESAGCFAQPDGQGNIYLINNYNCDTTFTIAADTFAYSNPASYQYSNDYALLKLGTGTSPTKITEYKKEADFRISPNPSTGKINLEYAGKDEGMCVLKIVDVSGKVMRSELVAKETLHSFSLSLEGYPKGIYWIELIFAQERMTRKLILE